MKWLTLDYIKQHSRIDFDCEDELLELYGESAEDTLLNICGRSLDDIIDKYGSVPKPLYVAALMLTEVCYTQRSPVTSQSMSAIPYAFDLIVKPYMVLINH